MSELPRRPLPSPLSRADLDATAWAHTAPTRRALGFTFSVRCTSPTAGAYLDKVLECFPPEEGAPSTVYSLVDRGAEVTDHRWQDYVDDERYASTDDPSSAVRYVLWHINRRVVEDTTDLTLVHAGGLELNGRGVLLPAVMESGKTTTTAGLIGRGMRYLSDEIVAVDPDSLTLLAYPKALSVEPGSFDVLRDMAPRPDAADERFATDRWDLGPLSVRPDSVATHAEPVLVITPRYVVGATSRAEAMGETETALVLYQSTFELARAAPRDLEVLGRLARRCAGFRLTIGDLDQACDIVLDLVDSQSPLDERGAGGRQSF